MNIGGRNDGRWLEKQLEITHREYLDKGVAKLEKVEPPTRWANGRVIPLQNPFVDYIGSVRSGRAVHMEAKSTEKPKLNLCNEGGLTARQFDALVDWEKFGAMCGVCWGHDGNIRFISMATMKESLASGIKHIRWEQAEVISQGFGFVLNDWLLNLRSAYGFPAEKVLDAKR